MNFKISSVEHMSDFCCFFFFFILTYSQKILCTQWMFINTEIMEFFFWENECLQFMDKNMYLPELYQKYVCMYIKQIKGKHKLKQKFEFDILQCLSWWKRCWWIAQAGNFNYDQIFIHAYTNLIWNLFSYIKSSQLNQIFLFIGKILKWFYAIFDKFVLWHKQISV